MADAPTQADDVRKRRRPQEIGPQTHSVDDTSGDDFKTPRSDDDDEDQEQMERTWRNWIVRGVFTIFMIATFAFTVRKGATWLMFLVFCIQLKCFNEIIKIGLYVYRLYELPWFRALSWYFLITSDYFLFGESLIDYWSIVLRKDEFLRFLVVYHRIISFTLYCVGFVWFVLSLRKGLYLRQFSLFAFTHVILLLIVSQSFLLVNNLLQGLIWFLVPVSMIICCDIMSYVFGFFFGRTPLIQLSPKKTREGFIGGAVSTVVFGIMVAHYMMDKPFFVCPVESYYDNDYTCTPPWVFRKTEYAVPRHIAFVWKLARQEPVVHLEPFYIHAVVLALFASLIAPFGGFFASGFKRAFKIKDFGDIIPGHGGLMDRFDCQLLMGSFTYAYMHSFIRYPNWNKIVQQILWLEPDEQIAIYNSLQQQLFKNGLLPEQPVQ